MERERVELIYFHIFYTALANEKLQTKNYNAMSKTPVFIWLRATFSFPSPPFQDIFSHLTQLAAAGACRQS
jgi:hypothetical protein